MVLDRIARAIESLTRTIQNPLASEIHYLHKEVAGLTSAVNRLAVAVEKLHEPGPWTMEGGKISFAGLVPQGGTQMYIVKSDHPDVAFVITPPSVTDSEGNPVPAGDLTYAVTSDNPGAVEITPSNTDELTGNTHFGAPNPDGSPALANVNVTITNDAGTMLGSFGAQFTVTVGDPAAITGGSIAFGDLVDQ